MKKNPVYLAVCAILLAWIATLEFGEAAAVETLTTIKLTACTSGSLTLPVHEALRRIHISWIDYIALKYWDSRGDNWIGVLHYNRSMACFLSKPLLPDGTKVLSCANGSLTLAFFFQSSFRKFSKYRSEVHLLDSSEVRRIFEVNFAKCIRRRKGANLNVTEVLINMLPWKQVIDITFIDTNNTAFAYCEPGRCTISITPRQIETRPSLHWIKRLENSAGSLVLNEIQMDDDGRKIIIKMGTTETAREETLMIRVTASQGITTTSSTTTQVKTTEVKTCTEDSLTLQNGIVDRSSIGSLYWKYRFQHESKWHKIAYCKRNLRVTCKLTTEELRDGTKVSIGANESLIVKHSAQSGSRDHIKFLFEAQLTDHTVFNHIFDHFAITCVWTRIDANLNLTGIVYGTYPLEQLDEIKLFDRNGTQFAYLHPQRGATVNVTDSKRQKSVFCGRLEVASDGSLMLNGVQMTCNGTEIKSVAKLKGSVQVKFFEVFVNSTGLSTISPSQMASSKPIKSSHITGPSSLPHSTATLYSNNVSASSISSATGKHATTTRPLNSESARANVQHWTMTLTVMATFICLFLRCPEVDKKCQQEFYRILDDAFTVPKARAPVSLTCYVGLKNPR